MAKKPVAPKPKASFRYSSRANWRRAGHRSNNGRHRARRVPGSSVTRRWTSSFGSQRLAALRIPKQVPGGILPTARSVKEGGIGSDTIFKVYARHKGWDLATAERWLAPIWPTSPEPSAAMKPRTMPSLSILLKLINRHPSITINHYQIDSN